MQASDNQTSTNISLRHKEPFLDSTRYILLIDETEVELFLHKDGNGHLFEIRPPLPQVLPVAAHLDQTASHPWIE